MGAALKVALIDYDMGNLRSIANAIHHIGDYQVDVTADPAVIRDADCLILPGVGAYPDAMASLRGKELLPVLNEQVLEQRKPVLGICLGMQLLFDSSAEGGRHAGLGWIPGSVELMQLAPEFRIPHVGWNDLQVQQNSRFFSSLGDDKNFYFVHSYHAVCAPEHVIATFEYDHVMTAAVRRDNVVGMQFHPEKSQLNGMRVLQEFMTWAKESAHA